MKTRSKLSLFILLILSSYLTFAGIIVYPFTDPVKEERFNLMIKELRCPKCQNNNLADSNSPLSIDLKDIVYEKIQAGESDEEIIIYLKDRYGDFISYMPPVKPSTWVIWYGPFAILLIAGFLLFRFVSGRQKEEYLVVKDGPSQASNDLLAEWSDEASLNSTLDSTNEQGNSK